MINSKETVTKVAANFCGGDQMRKLGIFRQLLNGIAVGIVIVRMERKLSLRPLQKSREYSARAFLNSTPWIGAVLVLQMRFNSRLARAT